MCTIFCHVPCCPRSDTKGAAFIGGRFVARSCASKVEFRPRPHAEKKRQEQSVARQPSKRGLQSCIPFIVALSHAARNVSWK